MCWATTQIMAERGQMEGIAEERERIVNLVKKPTARSDPGEVRSTQSRAERHNKPPDTGTVAQETYPGWDGGSKKGTVSTVERKDKEDDQLIHSFTKTSYITSYAVGTRRGTLYLSVCPTTTLAEGEPRGRGKTKGGNTF